MIADVSLPLRLLKEYRKLSMRKFRNKNGKMILEGNQLLEEALSAGVTLESLIYTAQFASKPGAEGLITKIDKNRIFRVDTSTFAKIAQTDTPQGVAAIARIPEKQYDAFYKKGFFLILDRIQDPGNLGTIIRTAAAARVNGIILLEGTADPYNPKALRASMGGIFYVPIVSEVELPDWFDIMKRQGIQLIAADPGGNTAYYNVDFNMPSAVIIGNESRGVRKALLEKAEIKAFIPLHGKFNTLNAAVAAAAFVLENERQKNFQ
ncbi:MAG: RNA methyltransferase [Firmicutes bacterium]|nr:RNA methyltransferase [Bacillota bacterium]